jgi:ABC-type multidrug transport system fused ATPase/permease subunit
LIFPTIGQSSLKSTGSFLESSDHGVASTLQTSGELTSFATYTFLLGLGTSGVNKAMTEISQGMVSAERVFHLAEDATNHHDPRIRTNRIMTLMQIRR